MTEKFSKPSERFRNTQSRDNFRGSETSKISDHQVNEPCDEHSGKFYEVFCLDHSEMCCIICLAENHRQCLNIKSVDEVVEMLADDNIDVVVEKDLNCLERVMTELVENKIKQVERINAEKDKIISEAECCINKAIDKLEKMKPNIKTDVSKTFVSKVKPLQKQIDTVSGFKQNIVQNERFLTTAKYHGNAKQVFFALQRIKKTIHAQRKMFEVTENEETDNMMFNIVLDQSLMDFIKNKKNPFESLIKNQSKGWKDHLKTNIMKEMDKLAQRLEGKVSLKNKSDDKDTIHMENNVDEKTSPNCISYKSKDIKAVGFMAKGSPDDKDSSPKTFKRDETSASIKDEHDDSFYLYDHFVKKTPSETTIDAWKKGK